MEKITFVKFYQAVNLNFQSNIISQKANYTRTAQDPDLIIIEKGTIGLVITTEKADGRVTVTEVPYNNVAYINYEAKAKAEPKVATKAKSSESK